MITRSSFTSLSSCTASWPAPSFSNIDSSYFLIWNENLDNGESVVIRTVIWTRLLADVTRLTTLIVFAAAAGRWKVLKTKIMKFLWILHHLMSEKKKIIGIHWIAKYLPKQSRARKSFCNPRLKCSECSARNENICRVALGTISLVPPAFQSINCGEFFFLRSHIFLHFLSCGNWFQSATCHVAFEFSFSPRNFSLWLLFELLTKLYWSAWASIDVIVRIFFFPI